MVLKDSDLDRARGKIETIQSYNQTLEKEVQDSRNKLANLNDEIHNG